MEDLLKNGASVAHGNISVTGTTSDDVGGSGIKDVQVRVDTGAFATATPAAPGNWSTWSTTVSITTTGSHTITAKATDNAGNTRTRNINIKVT